MPPSSEIIGHSIQRQQLLQDIESGNVAHAYLFVGPRHVGKATVARWFAKELLTRGLDDEAKIKAETQIDKLLHPDFLSLDQLWIEEMCEDMDVIAKTTNIPQDHRNGARVMRTDTIGIEDVRVMQNKIQEAGMGQWRACFIRSLERLQTEAGNALLKTLEEPPPGRVFLCTTQNLSQVLPTVISRMRVVQFRQLPESELLPVIKDMEENDQQFLLHVAQGAPGMLLRLKSDPDLLREERLLHGKALQFWTTNRPIDRCKALEPMHERTAESDRFAVHLGLTLREVRPPSMDAKARHFSTFLGELETNVQRQLAAQKFALAVTTDG